jgi:3-hydroxyisobutyrate dehydrogenase-like beta-hydroxyacid dehydrogenase
MAMKVGFIGLGVQGKYLAINLAQAGYDLLVYDLRPEPLQELAAAGARIAMSCREIGQHAEVVESCVLDDAQTEEVVNGANGVLKGARPGTTLVIHSTIRPATIHRLAEIAGKQGVEVMDVPVSGSETGARNKTMSYMAGGSAAGLAKCRPLFETSGNKIQHTGGLGTGIRAKLAHQLIITVNMLGAYEGMLMGTKAGLDPEILTNVIREGGAQSRIAEWWAKRVIRSSSRRVFYKDLQLVLEFGHELGLSLPGAALAQQMLDAMIPADGKEAGR